MSATPFMYTSWTIILYIDLILKPEGAPLPVNEVSPIPVARTRQMRVDRMDYETLLSERDEAGCLITLDRPEKRNAVNLRMMKEIITATKAAEEDPEVAAVIIWGGTSFFSAGADLNEALEIKSDSHARGYFEEWRLVNSALEELSKPVIAAIEGFCITGGLELALACDLRIAGESASFAMTSAKIGTFAGAGGTQRLPRLVGSANALEMLFSADPIDAREARRIGLVNQVVPTGEALNHAKSLVRVYKERAPLGLAFAKQAVHRGMQTDLASALRLETDMATKIYGTRDKQEGISAFLEKRSPRFRGT